MDALRRDLRSGAMMQNWDRVTGALAPVTFIAIIVLFGVAYGCAPRILAQERTVISSALNERLISEGRRPGQPCLIFFTRLTNCEKCAATVARIQERVSKSHGSVFVITVVSANRKKEAIKEGSLRYKKFIPDDGSLESESQSTLKHRGEYAQYYSGENDLLFEMALSDESVVEDIAQRIENNESKSGLAKYPGRIEVLPINEDLYTYIRPVAGHGKEDTIVLFSNMGDVITLIDGESGRLLLLDTLDSSLFASYTLRNEWILAPAGMEAFNKPHVLKIAAVELLGHSIMRIVGYLPVYKITVEDGGQERERQTAHLPFLIEYNYFKRTIEHCRFLPSMLNEHYHPQYTNCELIGDTILIRENSYFKNNIDYQELFAIAMYDVGRDTFYVRCPNPGCYTEKNIGINGFSVFAAKSKRELLLLTSLGNVLINSDSCEHYKIDHDEFLDPCLCIEGLIYDGSNDARIIRESVRSSRLQVINKDLKYIGEDLYCVSQLLGKTDDAPCEMKYFIFDARERKVVDARIVLGRTYSVVVPGASNDGALRIITKMGEDYIIEKYYYNTKK